MMRCSICGKNTREIKADMCLRCYVISRAIRLEPEMPDRPSMTEHKAAAPQRDYPRFNLRAFISDVSSDKQESCV
jgi:hypothetical protein